MRRLAAVFSGKRSDKSDAASSASTAERSLALDSSKPTQKTVKDRSGIFKSLSKGSSVRSDPRNQRHNHPMPPVSTTHDHAASSASSSSGGPTTPSDDQESLGHPTHGKKVWSSFLPDKSYAPALLSPTQHQRRPYLPQQFARVQDDASVVSSASESAEDLVSRPPQYPKQTKPTSTLAPVAYFRVITTNALAQPFSPPPLLHVPNCPLFPRSSNRTAVLSPSDSLCVRMHRKRLLNRISSADGRALAGYANKPGLLPNSKRLSLVLDDTAVKSTHRIGPYSQGLRRWAERPCFEDRVIVYLPSSDSETGLRQERVYATNAVEALGYSEELELLAGLDDIQLREDMLEFSFSPVTPELSFTPSTASLASAPPSPLLTASPPTTSTKQFPSVMYKPAPSPLRRESTESAPQLQPIPTSGSVSSPFLTVPTSPAASPSPPSPAISPATTKPAVRFAEDSDESIPLDYVMRYKQARDHKAKFLAAEKARRLEEQGREASARRAQEDARRIADERRRLEEARRKHEAERRKQEQERKNWEQERANWDRERRAIEEEKRQRTIHDELADARRRRESSRVGAVPKSNEGMVAWEGDREKERARRNQEARENYSRPTYDRAASPVPRRQSSDAIVPSGGASPSGSRNNIPFVNSSPGSSRPPSIAATGSVRGSSRPPSMYSTPPSSASDVRARRESKTSRRTSIVSDNPYGQQPMFLHPGTPTGGYPWGMVPPVPPMPMNMNVMPVAMPMPMMSMPMPAMAYTDLPLLPPAAPFMMHQFGQRSPNHRSHSSSPTRAKGEGSERGKDSPQNAHRRKASSDAIPATSGSSPYTQPQQQHSAASLRSSRSANPSMQQGQSPSVQRPTPVTTTSWGKQPGFQNLSRPQSNRRQTMIT